MAQKGYRLTEQYNHMNPRYVLRAEGIAVFAVASTSYFLLDGPLWLYALLFFAPDLGMIGYIVNPRVGSRTYNAVHTYVLPIALFGVGISQALPLATLVAAIWTAHIGFDRALGYGLKFPTAFGDTHLDRERFAVVDESTAETSVPPQDRTPKLPN